MSIPEEAIQAACHAYRHPNRMITNTSDGRHRDCMEAALEAALPAFEAVLRAEIVNEIEGMSIRGSDNSFLHGSAVRTIAARIAEGNTK